MVFLNSAGNVRSGGRSDTGAVLVLSLREVRFGLLEAAVAVALRLRLGAIMRWHPDVGVGGANGSCFLNMAVATCGRASAGRPADLHMIDRDKVQALTSHYTDSANAPLMDNFD